MKRMNDIKNKWKKALYFIIFSMMLSSAAIASVQATSENNLLDAQTNIKNVEGGAITPAQCQTDNDCNHLDAQFCLGANGTEKTHYEGKCVNHVCTTSTTPEVEDCTLRSHSKCEGSVIKTGDWYCDAEDNHSDCYFDANSFVDCNDGIFCNGAETCDTTTVTCKPAAGPVDCSANNLAPIGTCNYNPDGDPTTWDFFPGFTSVCDEGAGACTTGTVTLQHAQIPYCAQESSQQ